MKKLPSVLSAVLFAAAALYAAFSLGVIVGHYKFFPYDLVYSDAFSGADAYMRQKEQQEKYERMHAEKELGSTVDDYETLNEAQAKELKEFREEQSDRLETLTKGKTSNVLKNRNPRRPVGVVLYDEQRTYGDYTLLSVPLDPKARLINMHGAVVHEWEVPYAKAFPEPYRQSGCKDKWKEWARLYLYPNGDLLAFYHCSAHTPSGHGFIKIDRNSNVLWKLPINAHHDVHVTQDGYIYTWANTIHEGSYKGIEFGKRKYNVIDEIVLISPEGKILDQLPLYDAFLNTPFESYVRNRRLDTAGDHMHPNSIDVLTKEMAPAFPRFKPGYILVSIRNINALAVIDPRTRKVVWAAKGAWRQQHQALFMPNGNIQMFDNKGLKISKKGDKKPSSSSRIIEIRPSDNRIVWEYGNKPSEYFYSNIRGMQENQPNGNILITQSVGGIVFEITRDRKMVWKWYQKYYGQINNMNALVTAKRYTAADLPFLSKK